MQYAIATKLDTNAYNPMDINALYEYLSRDGAEAYEVIQLDESRRVIPYYDFDAVIPGGMCEESQYCLVNWLRDYVKQHWINNGYADCTVSVCTCIRTTDAGLKLSAHLYVHGVGSFDSALKLYQFRDAKHVTELRADFPGSEFIIKKDELFDSSVYKAADKQQKFRVLNSIKKANNGSSTDVVFSWCDEDDEIDTKFTKARLAKCMATVPADLLAHNNNDYNIKAVAPPKAPKITQRNNAPESPDNAGKAVADRDEYPPITADDCKRMMRGLPDSPYKTNRDDWRDVLSAYYACSLQYPDYGYDRKDMLAWALEWSNCEAYPQATDEQRAATLDEIKKIMSGAFEKKRKAGYLVTISKQYATKDDYDVSGEIVPTYWDLLFKMESQFKSVNEFVRFLGGCTRRISSELLTVILRMHDGFREKKIKDVIDYVAVTFRDVKLMSQGGNTVPLKDVMMKCWSDTAFNALTTRRAAKFTPFAPTDAENDDADYWNMFTGWGKRKLIENPERESVFLQHTLNSFASPKEADYFLNWLANKIQCPTQKQTMVVLYSEQHGTGKSSFLMLTQQLFGEYSMAVDDLEHQVLGRFNGALENRMMICCDEIDATGKSITKSDKLKSLVTKNTLIIEEKGREQRTVAFPAVFLLCSNHMTGLKLEAGDRRTQFLQVNASRIKNKAYWKTFYNQWMQDDYELDLFFTHLANRSLADYDANYVSAGTEAQVSSRLSNMHLSTRFLLQELYNRTYKTAASEQATAAALGGASLAIVADTVITFSSDDAVSIAQDARSLYGLFCAFCKQVNVPELKVPNASTFGKAMLALNEQYGVTITTAVRKSTGMHYCISAAAFLRAVAAELELTTDIFDHNIFLAVF